MTATRETARPQQSEPKSTEAPKRNAGKSNIKAAASVKTAAGKPTPPNLVVPTQKSTSPLEEISDLLDHLPLPACVELTRRFFKYISLPTGAARPRAVLKTVIFSWPNMVIRPRRTERRKLLHLAYCNADGVRGKKLELEHFLSQNSVDICLLIETFLNFEQTFRLANYVCHRTDRPTAGCGQPS